MDQGIALTQWLVHCRFLFEEFGEFPLLHEGEGWKVNATFTPVPVFKSNVDPKERSFTSEVKVEAPNGDVVTCSLPAIIPNTTKVHMTAQPLGSATAVDITTSTPTVALGQMNVTGVPTWKTTPSGEWVNYVVACKVETPKMRVTVYQVSGWEEAQAKPEEHGWAAPFTWLNMDFLITKPLTAPVTGVLGDTYPKPLEHEAGGGSVARARKLLIRDTQLLLASIKGLGA